MDLVHYMGDNKISRGQKLAMIKDLNQHQMLEIATFIQNFMNSRLILKKIHRKFLVKFLKKLKELRKDISVRKKRKILAKIDTKVWRILAAYS